MVLAVLYLLTAVALVWFRRAYRRFAHAPVRPRPPGQALSLYELAYLTGQQPWVARTAMVAMMLGGRLTAKDGVVTITDPVPRDEVEAAVIKAIGLAPRRRTWTCWNGLAASRSIEAIGERLADQGLVDSPSRCRAAGTAHLCVLMVLLCSGTMGLVTAARMSAGQGRLALLLLGATAVVLIGGTLGQRHDKKLRTGVTEAGRRAVTASQGSDRFGRDPEFWVRSSNDDLSRQDALLLGEFVRSGAMSGKLRPLDDATRDPSPSTELLDDPPGLGGGL
ncbi:TIGR04222 domain-containing membrane protein [Streptomyces sp. NPDC005931]|uniref:TIGR04222 domain-containing membrane protein n=1 Tax=Streptomyces sp. NPDC005931 TaxID=3364737 RepID=UPI0036964E4D